MSVDADNQSLISDITDINDTITLSYDEIQQKLDELRVLVEAKLSDLTIDGLKDKCKELGIGGISKLKKPELVSTLLSEFIKLWPLLKDKKANELKNICKQFNIKGIAGFKKDELTWIILQNCATSLIFRINESVVNVVLYRPKNKVSETEPPIIPKLTIIEELEQQRLEIELKMKEEIAKKQKAEEEIQQIKLEEERIRVEEEKKRAEEEKKKEKEEAKKKKQSIPKNVRIIVWNHYIGEDIIKHRCLCCKKVVISNTNFEVGHVLSEKNGGTHEINNLRPICFACNHSMGAENMIDFVVKYGLYIG